MMGGNSGGCRGESHRPGQIGEKWEMVTGKQKEGKRNRIKVIGDVNGIKKKKRNSATNIPRKPASVTNAIQGGRQEEWKELAVTDDSSFVSSDFDSCKSRAGGKPKFIKHKEHRLY